MFKLVRPHRINKFLLMVILFVLGQPTLVAFGADFEVKAEEWIYNPNPPIDTQLTVPAPEIQLGVSKGESLILSVSASDSDSKQKSVPAPLIKFAGVGPYEVIFACSANGAFNSADGPTSLPAQTVLVLPDVEFFVKDFPVTVTATIRDLSPPTEVLPSTGTRKDSDKIISWDFVERGEPPTEMQQVEGTDWRSDPSFSVAYTYIFGPKTAANSYLNQTVQERFGPVSALQFNLLDIKEDWLTAHPEIVTADDVANAIVANKRTGTFQINGQNKIYDGHAGFGKFDMFKAPALAGGVGWSRVQTYSCNRVTIGKYSLSHRLTMPGPTVATVEVKKDVSP